MLAISTSWFYTTQHFMTDFSSVFSASSFFFLFNFLLWCSGGGLRLVVFG